jgi:hypothetical protein
MKRTRLEMLHCGWRSRHMIGRLVGELTSGIAKFGKRLVRE